MLTDADLSKGEKDSLALDVLEPEFETNELQVSYDTGIFFLDFLLFNHKFDFVPKS